MENILRKPYEISLWEDYTLSEDREFYRERKLMIIGSNNMTASIRARKPVLKENVNGTHTLTFSLYTGYFDEDAGKFIDNPFIPYMVNERKVKLKYNDKWYDFIVKNIQEDSVGKCFDYTLTDSYINELSKNGFSITLDGEVQNNQGTISELAETILDGSDWSLGYVDNLVQKNTEALYMVEIPNGASIVGIDMSTLNSATPTELTIASPISGTTKKVYVFYSCAVDNTIQKQFLYRPDGRYEYDEDGIVNNATNYLLKTGTLTVNLAHGATNDFKGKRIILKEKTKFDNLSQHYVTLYKDTEDKELYMYTENEYVTSAIIQNLIVEGENCAKISAWSAPSAIDMKATIYPEPSSVINLEESDFTAYVSLKFGSANYVYNSGIISNIDKLNKGIALGEQYVFRVKYGIGSSLSSEPVSDSNNRLKLKVAKYTLSSNGLYTFAPEDEIFDFTEETAHIETEVDEVSGLTYKYYVSSAIQAVSHTDLKKQVGIFLCLGTPDSSHYYFIQDAQLFPYVLDGNNAIVTPGNTPTSVAKIKYNYYCPNDNTTAKKIEDIKFAYTGYSKPDTYTVQTDKTFEKIRSIDAKESNRFNLIQSLCETFECWPQFVIEHDVDGSILIGENGPSKTINFYEYTGTENYTGFKYGINLKSIKRTIDSEQIVSKIIVKPNNNQLATDGFCSIHRANDNPIGENYLIDFRYYIQQGLLDGNEVNNDLYLDAEGSSYLGIFPKLKAYNKTLQEKELEDSLLSISLINLESKCTAFLTAYNSAITEIEEIKTIIFNFCGVKYDILVSNQNTYANILNQSEIKSLITQAKTLQSQANGFKKVYDAAVLEKTSINTKRTTIATTINTTKTARNNLEYKFYQKYSKFIQEGSWTSEDYIDDNLYYYDAEQVLYTSCCPEISYTIDVLELSQLEDYGNYNFTVGDKTFIEDTEFFGYKSIDGVKTPYKEEIIVSEITYDLDSPDSNQIKVQNYKTQFEDLFQRITATTQNLQYQVGEYRKAANAFTTNGTLTQSVVQNSLLNNSAIIKNAGNQTVKWDANGITITNSSKPNEIVRMVSQGILITSDGGDTWSSGISGAGINTNFLTAGQIDAAKINVMSGSFPSFRWDKNGITAYKFDIDQETLNPTYFNFNNYIRFDQYGLYGIQNDNDFIATSLQDIKENANFGMLWDGFFLKSDHNTAESSVDGYIKISTDEDFQVIDGNNEERIKIGLLDIINEDGVISGKYGIRISDINGDSVMESNDEGQLWLKQKLVIGPSQNDYDLRAELGVVDTYSALTGPISTSTVPYSKILSIKNENNIENLAIYDNGKLVAEDAEIHGNIYATGGRIGNLDVESLNDKISGLTIQCDNGTTVKQKNGVYAPANISFTPKVTGMNNNEDINIKWEFSLDGVVFADAQNIILNYSDLVNKNGKLNTTGSTLGTKFNTDGICYLKATATQTGRPSFETIQVLTLIEDVDVSGLDFDVDIYNIVPDYPEILKYKIVNDEERQTNFTPPILKLKSYKGQSDTTALLSPAIKYDIYLYSEDINYFNSENNKWIKLNGQINEVIDNIITGNMVESPFNNYISFNEDVFNINIGDFYNYYLTLESTDANYDFYNIINNIITSNNTVLRIELKNASNKVLSVKDINLIFGTTDSMATFALTAATIEAAVGQGGLKFDAQGLHITNGNFDIKNRNERVVDDVVYVEEETLFSYDNNQLQIKGSGEFTGIIHATDGDFTGTVNANNGYLKDLSITGLININDEIYINGKLTEANPYVGIYSANYLTNENTGFYIKPNGSIIANDLIIGTGAVIDKYIRIGNTWILNPDWIAGNPTNPLIVKNDLTSGSFITIKDSYKTEDDTSGVFPKNLINIKQDGTIKIGQEAGIEINGNTQSIKTYDYQKDKKGWSIDTNTAEFNNIVARGSLKSTTFEYEENKAQSIGSILLVKPSSSIKSVEVTATSETITTLSIITETELPIEENDFIKISHSELEGKLFKATKGENTNELIVIIDNSLLEDYTELTSCPLINMGSNNNSSIVINGSPSDTLYPKNSISIFENTITEVNTGQYNSSLNTKLILGQMPSAINTKTYGIFNTTSYGLYAENVFLKGALISEGKDEYNVFKYSGLNTNSIVEFSDTAKQYYNNNTGNIILWAGADQKEDGSINIQEANFKVDNLGNLYANSGYFVGTIITDATITASKIKTAEIEGYQYKDENGEIVDQIAALTIKNSDIGIHFKDISDNTIMELNIEGLDLNANLQIGENFTVREDSSVIIPIALYSNTRINDEEITVITPNKIGFSKINIELPDNDLEYNNIDYLSYISNNTDGLSIFSNNIPVASFNSESIKAKQNIRFTGQIISLADGNNDRVQWKTVKNGDITVGYDLYLS